MVSLHITAFIIDNMCSKCKKITSLVLSKKSGLVSCMYFYGMYLSLSHTHTHTHTHTTRLLSNFGHYNKFEKKMFYYTKLIDEYKQINGIMINIIFMSLVKSVIYL